MGWNHQLVSVIDGVVGEDVGKWLVEKSNVANFFENVIAFELSGNADVTHLKLKNPVVRNLRCALNMLLRERLVRLW